MCASRAPLWCSRCACVRSNDFEINNILSGSACVHSNGLETMSGHSRCACVRADCCWCQPHIVLLQLKSVSLRMCASRAPLWCSRCACVRSNDFEYATAAANSSRCACVHREHHSGALDAHVCAQMILKSTTFCLAAHVCIQMVWKPCLVTLAAHVCVQIVVGVSHTSFCCNSNPSRCACVHREHHSGALDAHVCAQMILKSTTFCLAAHVCIQMVWKPCLVTLAAHVCIQMRFLGSEKCQRFEGVMISIEIITF